MLGGEHGSMGCAGRSGRRPNDFSPSARRGDPSSTFTGARFAWEIRISAARSTRRWRHGIRADNAGQLQHLRGRKPDEQLGKLVAELHVRVAELVARLDETTPDEAATLTETLASFTEEAGKDAPNKVKLRRLGNSIADVAKRVADIAGRSSRGCRRVERSSHSDDLSMRAGLVSRRRSARRT